MAPTFLQVVIVVPIVVVVVLFIVVISFLCKRSSKKYNTFVQDSFVDDLPDVKSLQFDLATVEAATNGFSDENKIGQGGLGVVYKLYVSRICDARGQFSLKSDVFSFGVLVLEIVSGMRNSDFYQLNNAVDLLSHVWKNWLNETPFTMLDQKLRGSFSSNEVRRCIHIALLCIQENPADRPSMATTMLALNSYSVTLVLSQQPTSFRIGPPPLQFHFL